MDTLTYLATVRVLFQAVFITVAVGAAVAGSPVPPNVATRRVTWARCTIRETTRRPTADVATFIRGHIGAVGWCVSHRVLTKRARIIGTVAFAAAFGPSVEKGKRAAQEFKLVTKRKRDVE